MQHLWMLYDVVLVWSGSCNNVVPGHVHHTVVRLATPNRSQQGGQTRTTCCARQCYDVLPENVAIAWPDLVKFNAGPTVL